MGLWDKIDLPNTMIHGHTKGCERRKHTELDWDWVGLSSEELSLGSQHAPIICC